MRLPALKAQIKRRLLVNFRVDPEVMRKQLPAPFQPKLLDGEAVAGICLIRLERVRPRWVPVNLGFQSENAAHRVAVVWDTESGRAEGVYIPRRDTSSTLNRLVGGRFFPGEHHPAHFEIRDDEQIDLVMRSNDGETVVKIQAKPAAALPVSSRFPSLNAASVFFRGGSLGYSATSTDTRLEGLTLMTKRWEVRPLEVGSVYSSYFANESVFPPGSVAFDCALIMREIESVWLTEQDLYIDQKLDSVEVDRTGQL